MGRVHGFLKLPTSRAKLLCVKDIGSSRGKEAIATGDVCDSNKRAQNGGTSGWRFGI